MQTLCCEQFRDPIGAHHTCKHENDHDGDHACSCGMDWHPGDSIQRMNPPPYVGQTSGGAHPGG